MLKGQLNDDNFLSVCQRALTFYDGILAKQILLIGEP